eukprot:5997728-Pyramimonas_sp.AAC.1
MMTLVPACSPFVFTDCFCFLLKLLQDFYSSVSVAVCSHHAVSVDWRRELADIRAHHVHVYVHVHWHMVVEVRAH